MPDDEPPACPVCGERPTKEQSDKRPPNREVCRNDDECPIRTWNPEIDPPFGVPYDDE